MYTITIKHMNKSFETSLEKDYIYNDDINLFAIVISNHSDDDYLVYSYISGYDFYSCKYKKSSCIIIDVTQSIENIFKIDEV